ncbi:hypothetical protein GGR19_002506 [Croceicoccus naphthovorans]|nr:hypothetical protein [Croceicoccus naphthovorans]
MKQWRRAVQPRQFSIEAVLGAVGWGISALPSSDEIPTDLRSDLEALLPLARQMIPALDYLPDVAAG